MNIGQRIDRELEQSMGLNLLYQCTKGTVLGRRLTLSPMAQHYAPVYCPSCGFLCLDEEGNCSHCGFTA